MEGYDELPGRWFGVGIEPLPLRTESEASRERINGWVTERTAELTPGLIPAGFLNANSVMVLADALHLEAVWARPFGEYPTEDASFTRLDGSTATVPLMHELERTGPAPATDEYAATELPFEGDELSMLVIVPEAGRSEEVEARLTAGLIDEIDTAATSGRCGAVPTAVREQHRPRPVRHHAGPPRRERGLRRPRLRGIHRDNAGHATDIAVDELGTVAAAATALGFAESGPPEP